jgi:glycosyltransferase involved in cell wall biosynthesis
MRTGPLQVLFDDSLASNPAGTGTFARGIRQALERTHGVELAISRMATDSLRTIEVTHKTPAHRIRNSIEHLRYYGLVLPARARRAGADVVFSPSMLGPVRGRIPSVITIHDLTPLLYPSTLDWASRRYLRAMLAFQARRSAAVCTVSETMRAQILEAFPRLSAERVHVAYDAPAADLLAAEPVPVEELARPYLLVVGTIEPRKNHVTAFRAFARYLETDRQSPAVLALAGSAGWRLRPIIDELRALGLESHVRRLGRVVPGQLSWLYRHARALLFPSLYEGFGIPMIEAFALGCPVIAARIPTVIEVVGEATATLIEPLAVEAWAAAIGTALGSVADRSQLDAARSRASAFTWEASAVRVREALLQAARAG